MDIVRDYIMALGDIYHKHFETNLSEEERAKKEVEQSYIILSIYKDKNNKHDDSIEIPDSKFRARIVIIDIVISENLMLMRSMQKSE